MLITFIYCIKPCSGRFPDQEAISFRPSFWCAIPAVALACERSQFGGPLIVLAICPNGLTVPYSAPHPYLAVYFTSNMC